MSGLMVTRVCQMLCPWWIGPVAASLLPEISCHYGRVQVSGNETIAGLITYYGPGRPGRWQADRRHASYVLVDACFGPRIILECVPLRRVHTWYVGP
jgi:hypothetical protein